MKIKLELRYQANIRISNGSVKGQFAYITINDKKYKISRCVSHKGKFNDEKIIVQGAVDVCFVENDGVVVLDFKTDRVDNLEALVEAYGEQLNIYAMACEKIFSMPVKQKIIYSFALSEEIDIPNVEAT